MRFLGKSGNLSYFCISQLGLLVSFLCLLNLLFVRGAKMKRRISRIEQDALIYFALGYASVVFPDWSSAAPSLRAVIVPNVHTDSLPVRGLSFLGPVVIRWDVWERVTDRILDLSFERFEIREAIADQNVGLLRAISLSILEYAYEPIGVESVDDPFPNKKKGWNSKGTL